VRNQNIILSVTYNQQQQQCCYKTCSTSTSTRWCLLCWWCINKIQYEIDDKFLQQLFSSVDVESAKAREEPDRQAILQIIRDQSLVINLKTYGNEHADVANVLGFKASCLQNLEKEKEAMELGKQALGIYERTLGHDHPETVNVRGWWGN
jgi:hypothetical protein